MQLGLTRRVFEAQPSDYTLTSSCELCHCSPLAGGPSPGRAPVGCPVLGAGVRYQTGSWIRHASTELSISRTLNEGLKGFRANFKPEYRPPRCLTKPPCDSQPGGVAFTSLVHMQLSRLTWSKPNSSKHEGLDARLCMPQLPYSHQGQVYHGHNRWRIPLFTYRGSPIVI